MLSDMKLYPSKFQPHSVSHFEVRGLILVSRSEGPFNAEHIQSLVPAFRELGAALKQRGPCATVNVVEGSILAPAGCHQHAAGQCAMDA